MSTKILSHSRARQILAAATKTRVLVLGDVMLDQFIWGGVSRISPEAPVPVVDFARESFMPGGAANVARNLVSLQTPAELFGAIGNDGVRLGRQLDMRGESAAARAHHPGPSDLLNKVHEKSFPDLCRPRPGDAKPKCT